MRAALEGSSQRREEARERVQTGPNPPPLRARNWGTGSAVAQRSCNSSMNSPPGASLTCGRAFLLVKSLTSLDNQARGTTTFSHPRAGSHALEAGVGAGPSLRPRPTSGTCQLQAPRALNWRRESAVYGQTPTADLKVRKDFK